jgi:hypothetical protein
MSLFTDYLASISANTANVEAAQKAAVAKLEAEARAAKSAQLAHREAQEGALLERVGLERDYQDLLETEALIGAEARIAASQIKVYTDMVEDAEYAANLIETKAQAIEALVSDMEKQGLLANQLEATKQGHLDSAMVSHLAAKAAKERIARLLANKKIK